MSEMYHYNTCAYNEIEYDMHGHRKQWCSHPDRDKLNGFWGKLFHSKKCAAKPCYENKCPYYKDEDIFAELMAKEPGE